MLIGLSMHIGIVDRHQLVNYTLLNGKLTRIYHLLLLIKAHILLIVYSKNKYQSMNLFIFYYKKISMIGFELKGFEKK